MTANATPTAAPAPLGPHPGDEPRGNPAARGLAVLTSLLLLALTGVALRDLWYHYYRDEAPSDSWLGQTWDYLGSFVTDVAQVTLGIVLIIVGLVLVFYTFKPRPHGYVRVNSRVSLWTRPVDVARKATNTVRNDLGGEQVRSKAGRNRLKVEVGDDGTGAALQERVTRSLNNEFKSLATPPAVSVKLLPNATATNTAVNAATNTAANPAPAPVAPEVQR